VDGHRPRGGQRRGRGAGACDPYDLLVAAASTRGRIRRSSRSASLLALLGAWLICTPALATPWRIHGPGAPTAGESATYRLSGPTESVTDYSGDVHAGNRACPPTHRNSRKSRLDGTLSYGSAAAEQLSFAPGHWTICIYSPGAPSAVARKVVRTTPGRDRLHITLKHDLPLYANYDDVIVASTGYLGRRGDAADSQPAADQHFGTLIVSALPNGRQCPSRAPNFKAPYTGASIVDEAPFSRETLVPDALKLSQSPVLCAYLTGVRRTIGHVRTRTVARASVVTRASGHTPAPTSPGFVQVTAVIIGALLIAAVIAALRLANRSSAPSNPRARQPASAPSHRLSDEQPPQTTAPAQRTAVPGAPPPVPRRPPASNASPNDALGLRRQEAVPYVIQRAVKATTDAYRDRLQAILERQDGPGWLDALNERRRVDMLANGRRPPDPYASLEPRAVLNCLAYDPAARQLIASTSIAKAKQLSGLALAAHHPDPEAPLTEADGYRAWDLYADITGHPPPPDPFAARTC
jgi:hypothetical protein